VAPPAVVDRSGWPGTAIAATAFGTSTVLLAASLLALRRHRAMTA
jgi:hypothetical protein